MKKREEGGGGIIHSYTSENNDLGVYTHVPRACVPARGPHRRVRTCAEKKKRRNVNRVIIVERRIRSVSRKAIPVYAYATWPRGG